MGKFMPTSKIHYDKVHPVSRPPLNSPQDKFHFDVYVCKEELGLGGMSGL
jgi:hypothetical protein